MQFEFNASVCKRSIYEMEKIEYRLRCQLEKMTEIYYFFRNSNDTSNRKVANKLHKEILYYKDQIRSLSVMKKSLEKLTGIYERNENVLIQSAECLNRRFVHKLEPPGKLPIKITVHIPHGIDLVLYKELK